MFSENNTHDYVQNLTPIGRDCVLKRYKRAGLVNYVKLLSSGAIKSQPSTRRRSGYRWVSTRTRRRSENTRRKKKPRLADVIKSHAGEYGEIL